MPDGPIEVDFPYCVAFRSGGSLTLVLDVVAPVAADPVVRLRLGKRNLEAPVTVEPQGERWLLRAELPAERLVPGTWVIALRQGGEGFRKVHARLLVSDSQPLALLPGPPLKPGIRPTPGPAWSPTRKLAERALEALPERRSDQVRAGVRAVKRRVPGR